MQVLGQLFRTLCNTIGEANNVKEKEKEKEKEIEIEKEKEKEKERGNQYEKEVSPLKMPILFDCDLLTDGYEEYLESARLYKSRYDAELKYIMQQFGIQSEAEAMSGTIHHLQTLTHPGKNKHFQLNN